MNHTDTSLASNVFLDTTYHFRTWRTALVAAIFGLGGMTFQSLMTRAIIRKPPVGSELAIVLFVHAAILFLTVIGLIAMYRFLSGYQERLIIDDRGITMGKKHIPWSRVRWIAGQWEGNGYFLRVGVKWRLDRLIWPGRAFTKQEFQVLVDKLNPFLYDHYPLLYPI